jgi:hypothetical protein
LISDTATKRNKLPKADKKSSRWNKESSHSDSDSYQKSENDSVYSPKYNQSGKGNPYSMRHLSHLKSAKEKESDIQNFMKGIDLSKIQQERDRILRRKYKKLGLNKKAIEYREYQRKYYEIKKA